ncbi:NucA/NucB deoxyribonuclease domain-containing protein [Amycolatopsis kentuckyensis]|uniref:NucA/NucB deoxyribonuclease domain-containing protein n=1 Tax=Amycolatopsis kentuckyensis TaxID=218823 RepID=UPI0035645BE8
MTGKMPDRPDTCIQKSRELRNAGKPGNFTCTRPPSTEFSQSHSAKTSAAGPGSHLCQLLGDNMFGQLKKREQCVKLNQGILIFEKDKPVGEYDFHITIYSATNNTSLRSTMSFYITPYAATGTAAAKLWRVNGSSSCEGDCTTQGSFGYTTLFMNQTAQGDFIVDSLLSPTGGPQVREGAPDVNYFVGSLGEAPNFFSDGLVIPIRCDNILKGNIGPGCVYRGNGLLVYQPTELPELVDHIQYAQSIGIAGSPAAGPLHRETNEIRRQQNRDKACPTSLPRPAGKDCDEYAFASTKEGAASGGPYDIRMIDSTQNQLGGTQLNSMYLQQRMLDNDNFYVVFQEP